jgi:hypothetical protein
MGRCSRGVRGFTPVAFAFVSSAPALLLLITGATAFTLRGGGAMTPMDAEGSGEAARKLLFGDYGDMGDAGDTLDAVDTLDTVDDVAGTGWCVR